MSKSILPDQATFERIEAASRVFAKADRVLSNVAIDVVVEDSANSAPSWTDGKTIWFNKSMIGSVTSIDDLIRLTGLNYHELAHVLYTPRHNSPVVIAVRSEYLGDAFNLLEDQRIETLLTSVYPSTIPYLVSTFMRFCIRSEHAWNVNYPLVYGRRYIPADVRAEFKRRFVKPELIPQFEAIIDEYRKLIYPADTDRGLQLIRDYQKLLGMLNKQPQDPNGHTTGSRPEVSAGRPAPIKDQRDAAESVDDMDKELEDAEDNAPGANNDSDNDADTDSDSPGPECGTPKDDDDADVMHDGDGESSGEGTGNAPSNGGNNGNDDSGASSPESGGGSGSSSGIDDKRVRDMFEDIARQFESLPDVIEDAANKQRAIVHSDGDIDSGFDGKRTREYPVNPHDVSVSRRFAAVLQKLRVDADPGWKARQSSGRINMRRAMDGAPIDELWDRWEVGNNDATDIECVILLDTSGSMMYSIDRASRAMWTIKRAMESVDANVTVITYSNAGDSRTLYRKSERVNRLKYRAAKAGGSTHPFAATVEAVRILEASRRTNKIFITITDGAWAFEIRQNVTADTLIEQMGARGITTALAFISGYTDYPLDAINGHKCKIKQNIADPIDLIDFAKALVTQTMRPSKVSA